MPPIGTFTVSPGVISCQVRWPATMVVGFCGFAPMIASIETPNRRAMRAGESPNWTV
jgi:hypothetical protein